MDAITQDRFLAAASRAGIETAPAQALYAELFPRQADDPARAVSEAGYADQPTLSRLVRTLLYAGVVLVIGAFGWWADGLYSSAGSGGVLALTLIFQAGFAGTAYLVRRRGYASIGGVLLAVTVFMTPLAVYSAERVLGVGLHRSYRDFYPWVSQGWMVMELLSIAVGAAAFTWFRRSFLLFPTLLFAYFLAMDGTAHVIGSQDVRTLGKVVGVYAAATFIAGVVLDYKGWRRHALWPHLFAMVASMWAIGALVWEPRLVLIIAAAIGIAVGVWLGRVSYLVGGGICGWIGITILAPSAPTLILSGLGLIGVSIWLAMANSPLRRYLADRTLPAPERL